MASRLVDINQRCEGKRPDESVRVLSGKKWSKAWIKMAGLLLTVNLRCEGEHFSQNNQSQHSSITGTGVFCCF